MTDATSFLTLEKVAAGYGPITVLHELSLAVDRSEVVALLGSNGSGKSTVLKTIMGLTTMTGGTIAFDGRDMSRLPGHRRAGLGIGYVPQSNNVFADLSVADNLRMGAFLHPANLASGLDEVFALFPQIKDRYRTSAFNLSGGERRMLAIGMALLAKPRVLLLDEPSSDLSPVMIQAVFSAIREIHQRLSLPVLLVEQNVNEALALATRVCVVVRGREALDVPVGELEITRLQELFLDAGTAVD